MRTSGQKNYYDLLGVTRDATIEQIRAAFTQKMRTFSPTDEEDEDDDEDTASPDHAIVRVITAAFTTLSNTEKRAEYDRLLPKPPKTWEEEEEAWSRHWAGKKILSSERPSPYAFGTFGVVRENPVSAFDLINPPAPPTETRRGIIESLLSLVWPGRS